jgi:predicted TIM-barrel fold metal-dependent hydrolase
MVPLTANNALRLTLKKSIVAHGIIDGHAHHNSGACCPLPLIYVQVVDGAPLPLPRRIYRTREAAERLVGLVYKEGVRIQKLSTFAMGNELVRLNTNTYAQVAHSMDFAEDVGVRSAGDTIASPIIIATMDMEFAHIAGYEGQPIYHEEHDKLFYYKRESGARPERDGHKVNLSHEIDEDEVDISKALKLKKWRIQHDETRDAAINNPLHLLPLYFYDPRRFNRAAGTPFPESKNYGAWDEIFRNIATDADPGMWAGVKMYPPLGHKPLDERCPWLPEFYNHCESTHIPILTHCSPGGMTTHEAHHYELFDSAHERAHEEARIKQYEKLKTMAAAAGKTIPPFQPGRTLFVGLDMTDKKGRSEEDYFFKNYVHPEAWRPVLKFFPDLHLCLAHFGGDEWKRGPLSAWSTGAPSDWINSVVELTKIYPNVYTDISCFNLAGKLVDDEGATVSQTLTTMLRWMLDREDFHHLKNKLIFGTDWYLTHLSRTDESGYYGRYCRDFKRLLDTVDPTLWIRFSLVNPWTCYAISKEKIRMMKDALIKAGSIKTAVLEQCEKLCNLDDEVLRIKEQLAQ